MKSLQEINCIVRKNEDNTETAYFNTGKTSQAYGNTYFIFCEMKPQEQISFGDFWKISQRYFEQEMTAKRIRVADKIADL